MSIGRLIRIWMSVNLLLAAILPLGAYAGFVDLKGEPCDAAHQWDFNSASAKANLWESIKVIDYDKVTISGSTDEDAIISWAESAYNDTGVIWIGYELTLEGAATFDYAIPPTSNRFGSYVGDATTLTFYSPLPVPPEDTVTMNFDINVAETGPFTFTLMGRPIPEPATVALLGLGVLALLRNRKA